MKIADDAPNRSIEAVMWDIFEEANRDLFDLSTIGTTPQYLRNRLWHAFLAGIAKGKEIAATAKGTVK